MPRPIYDYCDIAGASDEDHRDRPCFYAHDGSTCSLIRVYGTDTIMDEEDATLRLGKVMDRLAPQFRDTKHGLTISFERSRNIDEDISRLLDPLHDSARQKGLNMDVALAETEAILRQQMMAERILIAVWTYRKAAVASQLADEDQKRRGLGALFKGKPVQSLAGPYQSLEASHFSMVNGVIADLASEGFRSEVLGDDEKGRADLAEVRRALLFHETPQEWTPKPAGLVRYPRAKLKADSDLSTLFATSLDRQILTSAATADTRDLRSINLGGRTYAVMQLTAFPTYLTKFKALTRSITGASARHDPMPFRVAFHIEGGAKIAPLRQIMVVIGSVFSNANKRIKTSNEQIEAAMAQDRAIFAKCRIYATTWVEPDEERSLLDDRRSRMIRALNSWQSPTVMDSSPDPMRLLAETASGMTAIARTGSAFIAPVREIGYALPFHADAPPESDGQTIFLTMDEKPMTFRGHSPLQDSWFHLIFAPPGSGKSMLMNSLNFDFAAYYNSTRLPFIGMIDIGKSAQGFIDTISAALPVERRNEVRFVDMRNEIRAKDHVVNPFDIGLFRRAPLKREQTFTANFLKAMVAIEDPALDALIETVLASLYNRFSDIAVSSEAKPYQQDTDPVMDAAIAQAGIVTHDNLTWWNLVDRFGAAGNFVMAERAQRYAMPVLTDMIAELSFPETIRRYGEPLCRAVQTQIEAATNAFPAFSAPTTLDIGTARIVAIDLNAVIVRTPSSPADTRNNTMMFLMARELFVKKISGDVDELGSFIIPDDRERREIALDYWRKRYQEITQTRKRFCFDEFHITGSSPIMAAQIDQDVRQGRKWGFEIMLVSQRLKDFEKYVALASSTFILKSDSEQDRNDMRQILGVPEAAIEGIKEYVKGPLPNGQGATILIGRKMRGFDTWLLARNRVGPVRIWALTTTFEDRALRSALYDLTGDINETLRILALRFPTGTAKRYWDQTATTLPANVNVAEHIAQTILNEYVISGDT